MRNWHHELIQLPQAINLITNSTLKGGSNQLYVGVVEDFLEFSPRINDSNIDRRFKVPEYEAANKSLHSNKKNFIRQEMDNSYTQDIKINIIKSKNFPYYYFSSHTTSVASVIVGVDDPSNPIGIKGIVPNCNLISAYNFNGITLISSIQKYIKLNLDSEYHKNKVGTLSHFKFQNNIIPISPSDSSDINNTAFASIINTSFSWPVQSNDVDSNNYRSTKTVDFVYNELFAYGRDGRGVLVVSSAGNENKKIVTSNNTTNRYNAFTNKTLLVAASKVKFDFPNNFNGNNQTIIEGRSSYSNYGKRIDICAPSSPDWEYSSGDLGIYASANINCGDIGSSNDSYLTVRIEEVISTSKLRLSNNIKGIFPGQAIELGDKSNHFHEISHITAVQNVTINNINYLNVTLDKSIEFTKPRGLNLINSDAKVLVWKKNASKFQLSTNIIIPDDTRGLQNGQDIYLYSESDYNNGVQAQITNINFESKKVTINTSTATLPADFKLIPGQIQMKIRTTNDSGKFKVISNLNDLKYSFFDGQYVKIDNKYNNTLGKIAFKEGSSYDNGIIEHIGVLESDKEVYIKSLSYGDFTSKFGGTSAASPIVCGVGALLLSVNDKLNAAEIKHILKQSADRIAGESNYTLQNTINEYNYGYRVNDNYGTGRVNANAAVALALSWDTQPKPRMEFWDTPTGTASSAIPDSPDIWIAEAGKPDNLLPDANNLYRSFKTSESQKIYVKVRNTGNAYSFKEHDLRVLVAFTNQTNPTFDFPNCWHHNTASDTMKTILLDVQAILPIAGGSERVLVIKWDKPSKLWDDYKPKEDMRMYILAHISPFDGTDNEVSLADIRNNKNLTCKEIQYNPISNNIKGDTGKVSILNDQNKYELMVENQTNNKKFSFDNINVKSTLLDTMEFKFSLINKATNTVEQNVTFKKINGNWAMDAIPVGNWVNASIDITNSVLYAGYKNAILDYEFNYDNNDKEIIFNVINA